MFVEKLKNGKYRVGLRYKDPYTAKYKKVSITIEKNTKKEIKAAQQALEDRVRDLLSMNTVSNITLEKLCEIYMQDCEKTKKQSSVTRYKYATNSLKRFLGASIIIEHINAGYVRRSMLASDLSPTTINGYLKTFKTIMNWAYDNDYISDVSYLSKIKPLKEKKSSGNIEDKFLESEEIQPLLSAMDDLVWHDLTEFLLLSGLRISEAIALEIGCINMSEREIYVSKNYDINNDIFYDTPKTDASIRTVYIQDELLPLVKRLRSTAMAYKMVNNCPLIFQRGGHRINYTVYNRYLKSACLESISYRKPITPHALRHTHVSLLAEQGLTLDEISRRVGHEDSEITKKIYLHVTKKMKQKERENIKKICIL